MKIRHIILILSLSISTPSHSQILSGLPPGLGQFPITLFFDVNDSTIYAGGSFLNFGDGTPASCIGQWNGNKWDTLGAGIGGSVNSIIRYDNQILVGGAFNFAGGIAAKGLAAWDGNTWSAFASMPDISGYGWVSELMIHNGDLFICGGFVNVNNIPAMGIARYDGTTFHTYPALYTGSGNITTMVFYNNELYVGGNFDGVTGMNDIAKFVGANWVSVGGGLSGGNTIVNDLVVYNNELYVSGHFLNLYGDPGNLIAKWDGSNWSQVGGGLTGGNCFNMHVHNNKLFTAGSIIQAGSIPIDYFAVWDGNAWSNPGLSFDNSTGYSISLGNDLLISGGFNHVNGIPFNKVVKYNFTTGIFELPEEDKMAIFPNPASSQLTLISRKNKSDLTLHIKFFDLSGKLILDKKESLSASELHINVSEIPLGSYNIVVYRDDEFLGSEKIMIVR